MVRDRQTGTHINALRLQRVGFARDALSDLVRLELRHLVLPDYDCLVEGARVIDDTRDVRPDVGDVGH